MMKASSRSTRYAKYKVHNAYETLQLIDDTICNAFATAVVVFSTNGQGQRSPLFGHDAFTTVWNVAFATTAEKRESSSQKMLTHGCV